MLLLYLINAIMKHFQDMICKGDIQHIMHSKILYFTRGTQNGVSILFNKQPEYNKVVIAYIKKEVITQSQNFVMISRIKI